jgi:hypothetical protein
VAAEVDGDMYFAGGNSWNNASLDFPGPSPESLVGNAYVVKLDSSGTLANAPVTTTTTAAPTTTLRTTVADPSGQEEAGFPTWVIAALVAVIVMLLGLIAVLFASRKRP